MSLSENWSDEDITCNMLSIEGFEFERKDRNQFGRGVACYLKANMNYVKGNVIWKMMCQINVAWDRIILAVDFKCGMLYIKSL